MRYTIAQAKKIIENKIRRRGFVIFYHKSLSGRVYWDIKKCYIPEIKTRKSLYIACHELYHCLRDRKGKVYLDEFKGEKFAHRFMRHLGYNVPRAMTKRAKRYVAYKLSKACARGMRQENLSQEVKRWIR
jgi:hypothetical protein